MTRAARGPRAKATAQAEDWLHARGPSPNNALPANLTNLSQLLGVLDRAKHARAKRCLATTSNSCKLLQHNNDGVVPPLGKRGCEALHGSRHLQLATLFEHTPKHGPVFVNTEEGRRDTHFLNSSGQERTEFNVFHRRVY